jgi:DNA polymerase I-like protein with 3'-5' exonuclease and polymerase domains
MSQIIFTGNTSKCSYVLTPFSEGLTWLIGLDIIGLDTETNVVESILNRQLKVISIASEDGSKIWDIEWDYLTSAEGSALTSELKRKLCIIQSVSFDYTVFRKCTGTKLEKVWDTYLAEQTLTNGLSSEKGYHGLQGIMKRRFDIDMSKEEQLTFGDGGPYTDRQLMYAAIDVVKLGALRKIQISEMRAIDKRIEQGNHKGMMKTMWWENEFVKCVGDMEMTGVRIDKDKWYAIEDSVRPVYEEELSSLNKMVVGDFYDTLEANNWISTTDDFRSNVWSSSAKKKKVLDKIYDFEVEKTAKTELKKYLQEHDPDFPEGLKLSGKAWLNSDYPTSFTSKFAILKLMILNSKDWDATNHLNGFLMTNLKQFCIEEGWLRPAGQLDLNWASPTQRLLVFQAIDPKIPSTGKDVLVDFVHKHPIIQHFLSWSETEYQLKNFGKKFYDNHVEIDGKHRTRFNQILQTGRLSSVKPNMLNIPRKISAYRAAIIPDPGFELIDADYDGQELVITTELSKEPSWTEYLAKGYDLHSKNAELIFGQEWVDGTEEGCAYYAQSDDITDLLGHAYKKCTCKVHEDLRDASKAVSFGSIYGISYFKLAFNLKIPEERAKFILKRFFEIVPGVADMMERFGLYAIHNGHIIEPVFGRIRFFDEWKLSVAEEHGAIERAAFNTPIQSSGSAVLKIAFVLMRRWLNHNNLNDHIQLILPYHDETIAQAKITEDKYYVNLAKEKVSHFMMLGAKLAGFDVKASAKSGASWLAAH